MKYSGGMYIGLLLAATAHTALAQDNSVVIPQVSGNASGEDGSESPLLQGARSKENQNDYQKQILSNPEISDIGRANALTGGGGNTAVITQQGDANHSTIRQSGKDNVARQTQSGKSNDIYLDQRGDYNRSEERQIGDHNHKIIIQNGKQEESPPLDDDEQEQE